MRSFLTTVGIVIGVASVTAVIAGLTGLKNKVLTDFQTFGTNRIFVGPNRPESGPLRRIPWSRLVLRPKQFDGLLEHCPSVDCFSMVTYYSYWNAVRYGERVIEEVSVTGIDPSWHKVNSRSVTIGRPFSVIDDAERKQVCLVTPKIRDKLLLDRDCTGASILIGDLSFLVVGVVEPPAEMKVFSGATGEQMELFIPFSTAYWPGNWVHVEALAKSPEVAEDAKAEITFFLRRTRGVRPGEPDTFHVETVQKFLEQFDKIAMAITAVAGGIVAVSLLVGGIGIMNIMLVSVSERTREIGLRKAVGARSSAIMLQFLVEAVMLCMVGGVLGLLLGQLLTLAMSSIPHAALDAAQIPAWAVALSFGFAATVGLFFGMFPAIKAARLDPIDALRHE
jgi:putative ABC transport system permease protein